MNSSQMAEQVKKKCAKCASVLTRYHTLWHQYHNTKFAIPEAASAEVTDAEATDPSRNTKEPETNELDEQLTYNGSVEGGVCGGVHVGIDGGVCVSEGGH